jgi:TPR repeat protein
MRILTLILSLVCLSAFAEVTPEQFEKIEKKAQEGFYPAQCDLGICYFTGDGVLKNYAQAVIWFRKSAEQGWAPAQCYLGICYQRGYGVRKDNVEALKWYRKSAEQDNEDAQRILGTIYENSYDGIQADLIESYAWYCLAAFNDPKNNELRDQLERKMTPYKIEAGQRRAQELIAEIKALKKKKDSESNERVLKMLEDNRKKAEAEANKPKWWEFWR